MLFSSKPSNWDDLRSCPVLTYSRIPLHNWKGIQWLQTGHFGGCCFLKIWIFRFEISGRSFVHLENLFLLLKYMWVMFVCLSTLEVSCCEGYTFQRLYGRGLLEWTISWSLELYWKRGQVPWLLWQVICPHDLTHCKLFC